MTEVEFHTGVADPAGFVCRLLRKAYRQGTRALVTAPGPVLAQIDRGLWVLDEHDFVPHALLAQLKLPARRAAAALTPIWLAESLAELLETPHLVPPFTVVDGTTAGQVISPSVVVNVGAPAADAATMLALPLRWIEVVALDADEAALGRERWRSYKALGLDVVHHKAPPHSA